MKEITLALGGGGVKGLAHIGVIRRLEKAGYQIKAIAGTSAGGIVGAMFAAGYSTLEIEESFRLIEPSSKTLSRDPGDGPSILGLHGITQSLTKLLEDKLFSDLVIPFACTAVDLDSGLEIIINQGSVTEAIMGTIAIPGIFPPKKLGPYTLIDGGVLDPVPVAAARWLNPTLPAIAVCLTPPANHEIPKHVSALPNSPPIALAKPIIQQFSRLRIAQAFQVFSRAIDIGNTKLADLRLQVDRPDVVIYPEVSQFGLLDQVNPHEVVLVGELAAERAIPDIEKLFSWHKVIERRFLPSQPSPPGLIISPFAPSETEKDQNR